MMNKQVFALLNQRGLHNIDLPRYCNLGFDIGMVLQIENFNLHLKTK
jgi:hypothetical protein